MAQYAGKLKVFKIPYGPPGRSANSGITATVFGGYGFLGRYLVHELGACGTRVYAPFRGCEMEVRHLKTSFDLGQLGLLPFSARDEATVYEAVKRSDVVINLIGKHYDTKHLVPTRRADGKICRVNFGMEEVNVDIARRIARISKEAGVTSLIHMSSLSADLNSQSVWSKTKAQGEIAVREEFPEAIIVKPSTVFGNEDRFLNWVGEGLSRLPFFPLLNDGQNLVQPVHSVDIGRALMQMIYHHEEFKGQTFQLTGPAEYTYKEVVEFVADITNLPANMLNVPLPVAQAIAKFTEQTVNPVLTPDLIARTLEDNVAKDDPSLLTFENVGIEPGSMDRLAFEYLHRFRPGGHFTLVEGYH